MSAWCSTKKFFSYGVGQILDGIGCPSPKANYEDPSSGKSEMVTMTSLTSGVITPRSSATIGRWKKFLFRVFRKSFAGAFTHLPLIAVFSPAGISQVGEEARKWSILRHQKG